MSEQNNSNKQGVDIGAEPLTISGVYTKLTKEIDVVRTTLWGDVCCHIEVIKDQTNEQAALRALVGAGFTYIEGVLNSIRKFCSFMSLQQKMNLTPEEFGHLIKPLNISTSMSIHQNLIFKDEILYSLRLICQVFRSSHNINEEDVGWECLKKTIGIRNHLMHPKKLIKLNINENQAMDIAKGFEWFEFNWSQIVINRKKL